MTAYGYDMQDHLVRVTDANGTVTRYVYGDRDLLTEEVSEVSGRTTFRYNEHGELIEETDARGVTVTRQIDALDRVRFVDYPDEALDITYRYDEAAVSFSKGRLTVIDRAGTPVAYRYDRFGRLTQDGELSFSYDRNGNRVAVGYPGGITARYSYDFADRQTTLALEGAGDASGPLVTAAEYLPSGPLSRLVLGNGLTEIREFDTRYFPARITVGEIFDWSYATDAVGNITAITDGLDPAGSRSYGYQDVHYFLTTGNGPWGELSWKYDKIGNRLSETRDGATSIYSYFPNAAGASSPKLATVTESGSEVTRYFYQPGRYTRRDPDPLVNPANQLLYGYAKQNPTLLIDPLGLRIAHVDRALERVLNCAIRYSPPEFREALSWLVSQEEIWEIRELRTSFSREARRRRREHPGQGSAVDRDQQVILIDTRDISCENLIGDTVREITELYAHRKLGKSPDTILGFGGASIFADPIVSQARAQACRRCECQAAFPSAGPP